MNVGDTIEIDTGSGVETRKIASIGTAAGNSTTLWQPLPDGPVITIPAGSTNVPVTSTGGWREPAFAASRLARRSASAMAPPIPPSRKPWKNMKSSRSPRSASRARKPAWRRTRKPATPTIKVSERRQHFGRRQNPIGHRQRRTWDRDRHGHERRHAPRLRNAGGGRARSRNGGTGLDLAAPLKFNHAANIPFSVRGTGISFQPATAFAHSSNEPVQPLGTGITLDNPLANDHAINAVVRDAAVTTAGYQGTPSPTSGSAVPPSAPPPATWCCVTPPAWSSTASTTASVDPWAAEGYQGASGAGQGGCSVASPSAGPRWLRADDGGPPPADQ